MAHRRTFIKQIGWGSAGFGLLSLLPGAAWASSGEQWTSLAGPLGLSGKGLFLIPRSSPERQGVSSAGILRFLDAIRASGQEFHSIMILRHGHVIAEGWWYPYSSGRRQQLYSLSKSFTGTAIGLAVSEGLLTVDDPIIKFFPEYLPAEVSENLAVLKIR